MLCVAEIKAQDGQRKETPKEKHLEVIATQLHRDGAVLPWCPALVWHGESMMAPSLAESPGCHRLSAQPLTLNKKEKRKKENAKQNKTKASFSSVASSCGGDGDRAAEEQATVL